LALSYSILETARHWSDGAWAAFADKDESANIAVISASGPAGAVLFLSLAIAVACRLSARRGETANQSGK
jgi:hypothetical protein